MLIVKH